MWMKLDARGGSILSPKIGLTAITAALFACTDSNPVDPHESSSPLTSRIAASAIAQLAAAQGGRQERGLEDDMLRIEARIPGFGGLALDADGRAVVHAPAGEDFAEIRARVLETARSLGLHPDIQAVLTDAARTRLVPATFAFSQLVAAKDLLSSLPPVPGITSLDADELNNRVTVTITDEALRATVVARAASLGLSADGLRVVVEPTPVFSTSIRNRWRPTGAGWQVANANSGRCTLGWNVTLYPSGQRGILTASHCAVGSLGSGQTGGSIYQPTVASGNYVGAVQTNPAWNLTAGACGGFTLCANSDAMFVAYDTTSSNKRVVFTASLGQNYAGGSITATGWWTNVVDPITPYQGQVVDKMGRTTGWTRGSVLATCVNVDVDNTGRVLCAHSVTNSRVGQGDSGGPVFVPPPSGQITQPLYPVGILFAGNNMTNFDSSDGAFYCASGCTYWFTDFSAIQGHLNLVVDTSP